MDTARLRLVRRSSAPWTGMCKVVIIGRDNIICSFDYNLYNQRHLHRGPDKFTAAPAPPSRSPSPSSIAAICGEV